MLQEHRLKYRQIITKENKTPEEQEYYNYLLVKALGADSIEEAVHIVKAAGIQPDDLPELLIDQAMQDARPKEQKLTRRQQLGIDPIPSAEQLKVLASGPQVLK